MRAKELMKEDVLLVHQDDLVEDVLDVLVGEHIQGAPVVDDAGKLVGVVSQLDVYFGTMTRSRNEDDGSGRASGWNSRRSTRTGTG